MTRFNFLLSCNKSKFFIQISTKHYLNVYFFVLEVTQTTMQLFLFISDGVTRPCLNNGISIIQCLCGHRFANFYSSINTSTVSKIHCKVHGNILYWLQNMHTSVVQCKFPLLHMENEVTWHVVKWIIASACNCATCWKYTHVVLAIIFKMSSGNDCM